MLYVYIGIYNINILSLSLRRSAIPNAAITSAAVTIDQSILPATEQQIITPDAHHNRVYIICVCVCTGMVYARREDSFMTDDCARRPFRS
jgi:hypothetical protein